MAFDIFLSPSIDSRFGCLLIENADDQRVNDGLAVLEPSSGNRTGSHQHSLAGTRPEGIVAAVKTASERFARAGRTWKVAPDYDVDDVASIVVNAILGYTDYVNRTVWRK